LRLGKRRNETPLGAIGVTVPAVGAAAAHLAWLTPRASSLVTLARRSPVSTWDELRTDPGCVLLALRQSSLRDETYPAGFVSRIDDAAILGLARSLLDVPIGHADWGDAALAPIYRTALALATVAQRLAEKTGACDAECAWTAGLLTPLGWFAVAAVDSGSAAAGLQDESQLVRWGLEPAAIARRLCRRWCLPLWLTALLGRLDLAPETAVSLGADEKLFRIVQFAAHLIAQAGAAVRFHLGGDADAHATYLNLNAEIVAQLSTLAQDLLAPRPSNETWQSPAAQPLLSDLLDLAVENRRLGESPALTALDDDADRLHAALRQQHASETERLRGLKVRALAEFAAGAGHEINNPLAVISGQAQYLLAQEPDPARQRSLQKIVGQAQRVHHILTDLMQFARPPQPKPQVVNVSALIGEAAARVQELAASKGVRLECVPVEPPAFVRVDPKQWQAALTALLRNAVEAAPADGWAGIRIHAEAIDGIDFLIEDSGSGPLADQVEHLFDPFYSGRSAGRGRGLGLPTAWQLARVNGGAVGFDGVEAGVTRFVLRLPRTSDPIESAPALAEPAPLAASDGFPTLLPLNGHTG
jgi:two-component system NtrC family sensor kinase